MGCSRNEGIAKRAEVAAGLNLQYWVAEQTFPVPTLRCAGSYKCRLAGCLSQAVLCIGDGSTKSYTTRIQMGRQ
jgi:hypothetical protein